MTAKQLHWLEQHACKPAYDWILTQHHTNLPKLWSQCQNGWWMLWLLMHLMDRLNVDDTRTMLIIQTTICDELKIGHITLRALFEQGASTPSSQRVADIIRRICPKPPHFRVPCR